MNAAERENVMGSDDDQLEVAAVVRCLLLLLLLQRAAGEDVVLADAEHVRRSADDTTDSSRRGRGVLALRRHRRAQPRRGFVLLPSGVAKEDDVGDADENGEPVADVGNPLHY